jgi:hypothetical protein
VKLPIANRKPQIVDRLRSAVDLDIQSVMRK